MPDNKPIRESDLQQMNELAALRPKLFRGLLLPWFTADGSPKMRAAAVDRDKLCDDFKEFERLAAARYDHAVAQGLAVEKVVVDADALIAWCKKEGRPRRAGLNDGQM